MRLSTFFTVFLFCLIHSYSVNAFTNFLGELFNDLRYGSLDIYRQKIDLKKLKCLQGSHHFNGSCYFISNRKYTDSSFETDIIFESIMKTLKSSKKNGASLFESSSIGTAAELASLPTETVWKNALNFCSQLNNDSTLLYFNNNNDEYVYIINLLKRLNFPNLAYQMENQFLFDRDNYNEEQKYFIGLTFNNSAWKWINGMNISDYLYEKLSLEKIKADSYRKCSYLNLRDNGEIKIELTNCVNEKQPYICKYVLDRCYNNTMCGRNGECVNLPHKKTFECRCRLFYDGEKCEKWSTQGVQMLITLGLVLLGFLVIILIKVVNNIKFKLNEGKLRKKTNYATKDLDNQNYISLIKKESNNRYSIIKFQINPIKLIFKYLNKKKRIFILILLSLTIALVLIICVSLIRFKMIEYRISKFKEIYKVNPNKTIDEIDRTNATSYLTKIFSIDLCNTMNDQFLEDYIIIYFSLSLTIMIYFWNAFKCNKDPEYYCKFYNAGKKRPERNDYDSPKTIYKSDTDSQNHQNKYCFTIPFTQKRINLFNKFTILGFICNCRFEFPIPMSPFSKRNRFITGIIYAAYTYNILKIFEYILVGGDQTLRTVEKTQNLFKNFKFNDSLSSISNTNLSLISDKISHKFNNFTESATNYVERGILMDLLKQICSVLIIGLRYYPVLLCVELKRKSKFCYFICSMYVLSLLFYYVYMNIFCLLSAMEAIKDAHNLHENGKSNQFINTIKSRIPLANVRMIKTNKTSINLTNSNQTFNRVQRNTKNSNLTNNSELSLSENLLSINKSTFYDNIMYEKFIFYAVLCLITFYMLTEFMCLLIQSIKKFKLKQQVKKNTCNCCKKKLNDNNNTIANNDDHINDMKIKLDQYQNKRVKHEINYAKDLISKKIKKPKSLFKYLLEKYFYENRPDFRYSKQFINTQIIAFILLYYITCIIIRKSNQIVNLSSNFLVLIINFIFRMSINNNENSFSAFNSKAQLDLIVESLFRNVNTLIIISCSLTSFIYIVQLLLGIKNYHKIVLDAYRGIYLDIPSPKAFSNTKLASSSLHYSGYAIGYLLWGYLILFEVILVVMIIIRFLVKFYFIAENLAKIFLPILTIFLFKKILIWYLCRFFLIEKSKNKTFGLRNNKLYFLLNHFNFFFDCFLGSFVCLMRMAKSSLAALFFMPRLDYSIFGRQLEKTDMGFISYVTFIHMEVNQTHPIKCCFVHLLKESLNSNKRFTVDKRHNLVRNRWFLAVTLINNPYLKRERKKYLYLQSLIPKCESFEQFFNRTVKNIFINNKIKKKSKSTSCLINELNNDLNNNQIKTSTLNNYQINIYNNDNISKPPLIIPFHLNIAKINQNFDSSYINSTSNNFLQPSKTDKNSSVESSMYDYLEN